MKSKVNQSIILISVTIIIFILASCKKDDDKISPAPLGCNGVISFNYKGQTYTTVEIGNQCWMKENLNYETGISWCFENNPSHCDAYGRLYDWETALTVCPVGWHLPGDNEWKILEKQLGMSQSEADAIEWRGTDEGWKMKSTSGWMDNGNGSNSSNFLALPGGLRDAYDGFDLINESAVFWTSTEGSVSYSSWCRVLDYEQKGVFRQNYTKASGFSVRCLKN